MTSTRTPTSRTTRSSTAPGATPDDAYRYAQGEPLTHAAGFEIRLDRPLDFFAVTDHASFLGMLPAMLDPEQDVSRHPDSELARSIASGALTGAERGGCLRGHPGPTRSAPARGLLDLDVVRSAWRETIAAAERHNDPGRFTTFIAYEFTGSPENQNLHRNVIFRGSEAPEVPFSRLDSFNPEELWGVDGPQPRGGHRGRWPSRTIRTAPTA